MIDGLRRWIWPLFLSSRFSSFLMLSIFPSLLAYTSLSPPAFSTFSLSLVGPEDIFLFSFPDLCKITGQPFPFQLVMKAEVCCCMIEMYQDPGGWVF